MVLGTGDKFLHALGTWHGLIFGAAVVGAGGAVQEFPEGRGLNLFEEEPDFL